MKRMLNALQQLPMLTYPMRAQILRAMGVLVGEGACIDPSVCFTPGSVSIGDRAYINAGCFLDGSGGVLVGDRCALGQRVNLVTSGHEVGGPEQRAGERVQAPVVIGDGCWLGAEVMVLPGVTIAPGCIIAARSLVTRDTQPNGLYMGSPAKRVRDLPLAQGANDDDGEIVRTDAELRRALLRTVGKNA